MTPRVTIKGRKCYSYYLKSLDKIEKEKGYSYSISKYLKVTADLNILIRDFILAGNLFKIPGGGGTLSIKKKKRNIHTDENGNFDKVKNKVDYGATRKLWKELYPNLSIPEIKKIEDRPKIYYTSDYTYKWDWNKSNAYFRNTRKFAFKPCRVASRKITKLINCGKEYRE